MRRCIKAFFFLLLIAQAYSCSHKLLPELPKEKLERRKTSELIAAIDSISHKRPRYFYSKIKCEFTDTNQHRSFKTSIRLVRDSAMNALITYAAIPIVNSMIRPDSVIISNRTEKCVIRRDLDFIREQFGVSFDYRNVEELMLGLPVGYDTTQKYFQIHDPHNYILSSHKKRIVRRELRRPDRDRNNDRPRREGRNNDDDEEEDVILNYYLSDDLRSIKRVFIDSPDDTTAITVDYLSRDSVNGYLVPNDMRVVIVTPRNRIVLTMDYDKSEVNVPVDIHFVIPEEYGECGED